MDAYALIALAAIALLVAELLLPTGGLLAVLGALGLVTAGIVALTAEADSTATEYIGPALITLGILSIVSFYFITRKVLAAHRDEPVRSGSDQMPWWPGFTIEPNLNSAPEVSSVGRPT